MSADERPLQERIDAQMRQLRSMRQYRDRPEDELLRLAIERVTVPPSVPSDQEPVRGELIGQFGRAAGDSLLPEPWFVGHRQDIDEIVLTPEPTDALHCVYAWRREGRLVGIVIALDAEPL